MSATDPSEPNEFNLAMSERITALGASPSVSDLRSGDATNILFRQLIGLLTGTTGNPGFAQSGEIRSTGKTLASADDGAWFDADTTGGDLTFELPDPAAVRSGWNVMLRKRDATANRVLLTVPGGAVLDGANALSSESEVMFVVRTSDTRFTAYKAPFQARDNFIATADPGVGNDVTQGYNRFSRWANTVANTLWLCVDPSAGAAVWIQLGLAACLGALTVIEGGGIAIYSGPAFVNGFAAMVTDGGSVV